MLVVDDHAVVRRGLLALLEDEPDLEVVAAAADGQQALDVLERLDREGRRPRVVLMDLEMEPVDGIAATRRIRARYDDVEIIALTSFGEDDRVQAALRAGASGFLLKDADADELAPAIRAAERGESQLDPIVARRLIASLRDEAEAAVHLTGRELEVLRLIAAGEPNKRIAAALSISDHTVRTHVTRILAKLGLTSRTQAALWATRQGMGTAADEAGPTGPVHPTSS